MEGLYLKLHHPNGKNEKMRIGSFMIHEESQESRLLGISKNQWHQIPEIDSLKLEGSAFRFLKCLHCGHFDFNDDSWDINVYECNGCGQTIGATEWNKKK